MLNSKVDFDFSIMKKLLDVAHGKLIIIIDNQYIDFESTLPPEFERFWRNKTETKYVHM